MRSRKVSNILMVLAAYVLILAVAGFALYAISANRELDPLRTIYRSGDLEVRAVCTVQSGLLVTVEYNARWAGDTVSSVRMTPDEWAAYCPELP